MVVKTSKDLTPSTPIKELSGFLSLCHPHPASTTSKRQATEIIDILYSEGIKTVGELLALSPSYFDCIDGLGKKRYNMLTECYVYLNASGIGED